MVRINRIPSWSFPNYKHRLPEHYYKHRVIDLNKPSARVYDEPPKTDLLDLRYNEEKSRVERIPDVPISVIYPKEADMGLWGGEGVVKGYIKPRKYFQAGIPRPRLWFPNLMKVVLYSEILDKHFTFICTKRTLKLIDEYHGLDGYILRSRVQDLKSQLGLFLRRKLILTLANNDFEDQSHGKEMIEKYGDCIIPIEEAEWFGLTEREAVRKQRLIDAKNNVKIPLKYEFTRKLLEELQSEKDSPKAPPTASDQGWLSKFKSTLGLS